MKKMLRNKNKVLFILAIIIVLLYIISISPIEMQNDTFWSIKVGEKILKEGFNQTDNFSIHKDLNYIAQHYIVDIIIYLLYNAFGLWGLYVFQTIVAIIITTLLYTLNKLICKDQMLSFVFLFIQLFILSGFISVRAQMISFIIFIIEIILLEKYLVNNKKAYLFGLGLLPFLLANFHMGTIPFYFIILGVYILNCFKINFLCFETNDITDKIRLKELLVTTIIGLTVIFINPYFINEVFYFLKTISNSFINDTIQEFQPFSLGYNNMLYILLYMFTVILVLIVHNKKINVKDICLIFGTIFMGFLAIRYISLMIISTVVILKYIEQLVVNVKIKLNNNDIKSVKIMIYIISFIIFISCMFQIIIKFSSEKFIPEDLYPIQATKYIKENLKQKDIIFNVYEWGSYLMLNEIPVFIDSRCDLYTKEYNKGISVAEDYNKIQNLDKDCLKIINKYKINMILIRTDSKLYTFLENIKEFDNVYEDRTSAIFRKT